VFWLRQRHGELFNLQIKELLRPEAWAIVRMMSAIGILSLLMGINTNLVKLILRSVTVHQLGVEANGLYQGVTGISGQVVTMALGFLSLYAFPKVSETHDPQTVNLLTGETVRFTTVVMTAVVAGILLFRGQVIRLLLSDSFLPATALVPAQAGGDFFFALGTAIQVGVLSVGPRYAFALLGISFYWAQVPAFFLLYPLVGVAALPYSYLAGAIVYCAICLAVMRRYSGLHLPSKNLLLLVRSVVLLILIAFLANVSLQTDMLLVLLGCLWFMSVPTMQEWQSARRWLRASWDRVKGNHRV
jgi:hypothetical protein